MLPNEDEQERCNCCNSKASIGYLLSRFVNDEVGEGVGEELGNTKYKSIDEDAELKLVNDECRAVELDIYTYPDKYHADSQHPQGFISQKIKGTE